MNWQELTLKIAKTIFESLPLLIWPIGFFTALFYFRKPLLSMLKNTSGLKIKAPFGDIEIEMPVDKKVVNAEMPNSDIDKNDESKPTETTNFWLVDVIESIENGDIKEASAIFERYKEQERDSSELYKNTAYYFEYMYIDGNQSDFIFELEKHISGAKNEQEKITAITSYTRALEVTKQYQKAIDILNEFIINTSSEELKSTALTRISACYISNNEPGKARELILEALSEFHEKNTISSLYINLSKIEESVGNKKISSLCLDKAVELNPTDQEILFDSAFQASENGLSDISICNYSTLIGLNKKHASALNNIAICAENEKLDLVSVKYYKDSAEQNNSLAMVNQGFRLLNAGFSKEAEEIAKKALMQESPHQRAHALLTSIHEKREKQHREWIECKSKATILQQIARKFISAYTRKPKNRIQDSTWMLDNVTTSTINNKDAEIEIKWQEEIQNSTSKYECSLTGKIINSAFEGDFFKYANPKPESTLLGPKYEAVLFKAYGYLNETENILTIIDIDFKKSTSFTLERTDT
ncbi:TPA: hypothetical protein OT855_002207 [Serratia liquefaciens]|nr:hypothetical protein [Serratia liquefaciens]